MDIVTYADLAERTLPTDLTDKELLSMLCFGLFGELHELDIASLGAGRRGIIAELGDCYWYAALLGRHAIRLFGYQGETELITMVKPRELVALPPTDPAFIEAAKKAIFHDVSTCALQVWAEKALNRLERFCENTAIDAGEVRRMNIDKLKKRYPDGFVLQGGIR